MQQFAEGISLTTKILLIVCTVCGALALPLCKMLGQVSPYLICAWRCIVSVLVSLPLAAYEIHTYGTGVVKLFSVKNLLLIVLCQVYSTLFSLCQLIAVQYTFSCHALLFSGMTSIVLIFWKIAKRWVNLCYDSRLPITTFEIAGILCAVLGSVIITQNGGSEGNYTRILSVNVLNGI